MAFGSSPFWMRLPPLHCGFLSTARIIQIQSLRPLTHDPTWKSARYFNACRQLIKQRPHFAVFAQKHIHSIPLAPAPTFTMNEYTFYRQSDGWIESNIRVFMDQLLIQKTATILSFGHHQRMTTWLYHKPNLPPYVYHRATSAYTVAIQLYARSGQLATETDGNGGYCRLGCQEIEDEHHIFMVCLEFKEWREQAGKLLRKTLDERLSQLKVEGDLIDKVLKKAEYFFADDPELWPLKESHFYLGHVPYLPTLLSQLRAGSGMLMWERTIHGAYCDWHNASVRLASRIYGDFQRQVTRSWDQWRRGMSGSR